MWPAEEWADGQRAYNSFDDGALELQNLNMKKEHQKKIK